MPASSIILDRVQAGLETTRGTAVAATRKLYVTGRNQSYDRTLAARSSATGTYQGRRAASYSRAMGGLQLTDVLTFESAPWWFMLCMSKTPAAVGDSGTPTEAQARTYKPDMASDTLASATIEGIDKQTSYDWAQAMVNQWNIRWDSDSTSDPDYLIETTLLTLAPVPAAQTGSIGDRTEEAIPCRGTKVYIDDGGDAIGTTQRTGMAISGSISGNNNLSFPGYSENETGPAPGVVIRGEATVDAQLVLSFQNDDDFADFRSDIPVFKKIRLERSGTTIHTTVKKRIRFDIYGYWSAIAWGDRNGERTVTLSLMGFVDATAASAFVAEVVNDLDDPLP